MGRLVVWSVYYKFSAESAVTEFRKSSNVWLQQQYSCCFWLAWNSSFCCLYNYWPA